MCIFYKCSRSQRFVEWKHQHMHARKLKLLFIYILSPSSRDTLQESRRISSQLLFYKFTVIDYFWLKAFLWTLLSLLFLSAQLQDYQIIFESLLSCLKDTQCDSLKNSIIYRLLSDHYKSVCCKVCLKPFSALDRIYCTFCMPCLTAVFSFLVWYQIHQSFNARLS